MLANGLALSPSRYYISGRDRDPAEQDRTAALIIFIMLKTKQVHYEKEIIKNQNL
ncbi:MAG: hypothetical protein NTX44_06550 [Ignavibacteriales bacterium]|nr:hypothetical protein [Ignavibacteriales bacterium]